MKTMKKNAGERNINKAMQELTAAAACRITYWH